MTMKTFVCISFSCLFGLTLLSCREQHVEHAPARDRSVYALLPITQVTPKGWLRTFLERQSTGLTGNIEVAGYPFDGPMWTGVYAARDGERFWWPYEQTGYFVDGCLRTGYLLNDTTLVHKALKQVDYVLAHQQPNGRLGPDTLKGRWNLWPYAGFLRAFMTAFNVQHDSALVKAMQRHYAHYQGKDFADELDLNNVEEMCWLFGITGDSSLLHKAEEAYATFKSDHKYRDRDGRDIDFASDMVPNYHGVCYIEIVKIPAILYSYTGKKNYLDEAEHGIAQMEKYHMLASGVPSASEHFGGQGERSGHETCNVTTLPYTYGYMLRITGGAKWGDKIEKAVFNAGIGSVTKDFKAHQYFSSPNQFLATMKSCHLGYNPARFVFAPGHDTECCTGNVNRFMPYYVEQLWLQSKDHGVVASMFGASEITAEAGADHTPVRIEETTGYPFDETITFTIRAPHPVKFPFYIRIPGWTEHARITYENEQLEAGIAPGSFFKLEQTFKDGDRIVLSVPMNVQLTAWPNNGVSIARGPIVYSYPIPAEKRIVKDYKKSTPQFPAFELLPTGAWNYAVDWSNTNDIKVVTHPGDAYPWDVPPVVLEVPAQKLKHWKLFEMKDAITHAAALQTPAFPEQRETTGETETLMLVPYGSTLLRLTVFPKYH